ncbi:MAG: pantoate--beta-alanine ligase [Planktomarina sp.]
MLICPTKSEIRAQVANLRRAGKTIGLVPTMGFLHDGHLQLVRRAIETSDAVIVTIFVNPTQFGPNEDLDKYPRDMERDLALLRAEGVAAVFTPTPDEMYLPGADTVIDLPSLSGILQGELRPGHFQGVATVVTKLFNITQPDLAVFGEKDFQQLTIIRRMVADLDQPVRIIGHPTAREADGLAMSSRNVRLTPEHRATAPVLNRAMTLAANQTDQTAEHLIQMMHAEISEKSDGQIKSLDIRDAVTLAAMTGPITRPAVILLAVKFGEVLLIDQRVIGPEKDDL